MSSTYDRIADLQLTVDGLELERLSLQVSPAFERVTTVLRLRGGGYEGRGEDVIWEPSLHEQWPADLPLAGSYTVRSWGDRLDDLGLEQLPGAYGLYRRWAIESAGLDLALRQAQTTLHEALGREPRPLTFVASTGIERIEDLDRYPAGTRFKLDAAVEWTDELIAQLRESGVVDVVDLKGFYPGTTIDTTAAPGLYRRVAEGLPDAWIEDPWLDDATSRVLEPHRDRLTWDEPIHSLADVRARAPRVVNVKPSRIGGVRKLLELYDGISEDGIGAYGGGQFELGPGRPQIQYLAAIFHPDAPNDVAPHEPGAASSPMQAPVAFGAS